MKNLLNLLFCFIVSANTFAQVAIFHPVKIHEDDIESLIQLEQNYSKKMAQNAVDEGDLVWWGFLRTFNATSEDYNFMFVNVYKDIDAAVSPKANWWNNAKKVVGIEPSILMDAWVEDAVFDRRYIYQFRQQINSDRQGKFLIFNFGTPESVERVLASNEKYIIPAFKKNLKTSGMTGWGAATKITPQGANYSSFMTYDAFDTMANLMKHLSGDGTAIKGIDLAKIEPLTFESRYIFEVLASTN